MPPGSFLKQALSYRQKRLSEYAEILSKIIKEELNIHLLSSLIDLWKHLEAFFDLLNSTETESKIQVDKILLILKPYSNRNQIERTNLLIQVQRLIEEQLLFINQNTTYFGRTFFFPLLNKWKRVVINALEKEKL